MTWIKLIAADIDGTLIGADGLPSDSRPREVSRLRKLGVRLILISGSSAFPFRPWRRGKWFSP